MTHRISVIDSHTGGEPTRVVIAGGPPLGTGPLSERLVRFRSAYDRYRTATVNEPRASDAVIGGLLCEPEDPACCAGVIFFNNVGYLGMCGHGTIGLVVTLRHMGRIGPGVHKIETPVGVVEAELHTSGEVTVGNVISYRRAKDVEIEVPGYGCVTGDVAWGGNWFFLVDTFPVESRLENLEELTTRAWSIRQAVNAAGYPEVDHVELHDLHHRNFVLCPGKAYDRSPCGTGTSAKMACLYADGKLQEAEIWRQESIIGSTFEGWVRAANGGVRPFIRGSAHVTGEAALLISDEDPFGWGI